MHQTPFDDAMDETDSTQVNQKEALEEETFNEEAPIAEASDFVLPLAKCRTLNIFM